jgi:transposase
LVDSAVGQRVTLENQIRGLAVLSAVVTIDADMRRMTSASPACRRLMTIPGTGHLTALAFTAAVDDPERFKRSREIGAYFGLVPRRYQSGEIDYTGSISKGGDKRVRTLLYEAANVMLTRYKKPLKLKDWVLAIARRSTLQGPDRAGAAPRHHHARHAAGGHRIQTGLTNHRQANRRPNPAPERERRPGRERMTAPIV